MHLHILTGGEELYEHSKTTCEDGTTDAGSGATSTTVSLLSPGVRTGDLLSHSRRPKVLLICASEIALLGEIRTMQRVARAYLSAQCNAQLSLAPVLLAVNRERAFAPATFDALICDRVWLPLERADLVQRAKNALLSPVAASGACPLPPLQLDACSFSATYQDKQVRLTKSEFMLAKLFLGRLGSVISLSELFDLFSAHGKAATRNNIRVGIFELRLKLEKLCGSALDLVTVYRRGYALRHNMFYGEALRQ
ncbi:MAG TPA: winged helix-turn-helix domain-containing protein [Telluria sp.]